MAKGKWTAHLALFTANLIYGANYTIAKGVMPTFIEPFGFILLRVLGALFLFWLISAFYKREKVHNKDLVRMALCGLFGVAMNQMFFFTGLNITTPINASIIMTSNPILVLLMASALIGERITMSKIVGIGLGLTGAVAIILLKGNMEIGGETLLGDLFVLINASCFAIFLVIVKPLMRKYSPLTVIKWVFLFGSLYVLPFGFGQLSAVDWDGFPLSIWFSVAFVVIGTTFFAYLLNSYGLDKLSSSVVSTYIYLQPVLGSAIAILLGKDSLDPVKIVSTLLIFTGVYLVSKRTRKA